MINLGNIRFEWRKWHSFIEITCLYSVVLMFRLLWLLKQSGATLPLRSLLLVHVVFNETTSLDKLCRLVGQMAGEQQPVTWLHLVGEPHEEQGIAGQSKGHPATDYLRALLHICDGGYRKTPVCYWTPEMCAHQIFPELLALQVVDSFPCNNPCHGLTLVWCV